MQSCPSHCGFKTNRPGGIAEHFKAHPGCIPGRKVKAFKGYNQLKKMTNGDAQNGGKKKGR